MFNIGAGNVYPISWIHNILSLNISWNMDRQTQLWNPKVRYFDQINITIHKACINLYCMHMGTKKLKAHPLDSRSILTAADG